MEAENTLRRVLQSLREPTSKLFQPLDQTGERFFVAELRQAVLSNLPAPSPEIPLELATVAEGLQPLTVVEKQAAWFETMAYDSTITGELMRIAPSTVEKIRARAAELIRGKVDAWRLTLLSDNGILLGREATAAATEDCLPVKAFLDILDGRTTWRGRELMEQHVASCWHCIDHYCRMQEVIGLLRACKPLTDAEAAPYFAVLGVTPEKRSTWKRLLGA